VGAREEPLRREGGDEAAPDDPASRGFSVYDHIRPSAEGKTVRALIRLLGAAVGLVWRVDRRQFAAAIGLQVLASLALTAQLFAVRHVAAAIVDAGSHQPKLSAVLPGIVVLAVVSATIAIAASLQAHLTLLLGEKVGREAQEHVLEVASAVDLDAFERPAFYDRLERARFNAGERNMAAVQSVIELIGALLGSVAALAVIVTLAPVLGPLLLIGLIPGWRNAARYSRELHRTMQELTPIDRERTYLMRALSERDHAKEVRAFGVASTLRARHGRLYDIRIDMLRRLVRGHVWRGLVSDVAGAGAIALTLALVVLLLRERQLSVADGATVLLALVMLGQRLRSVLTQAGALYESSLFVEDFTTFVDLNPETGPARERLPAPAGFESIVVDDVHFAYPGTPRLSLRGVSLEINAGEIVALVGANGSGKTTLAKLLSGLHTPSSGKILWDGVDVACVDPSELRRSIAVLFQDFVQWQLPARDNIALGRPELIDDAARVHEAAETAGASPFLERLPAGYETILSRAFPGGRDLSTGQWQRVALARAFFRDAPLLIMDEPTASLDPLAEYQLFNSIRELVRGRSVLFISHRFSSVKLADRIYVLSDGEIIEHGSHDELMATGGRYAHFFTLQASAYLDEPSAHA